GLLLVVLLLVWAAFDLETRVEIQRVPLFTLPWGERAGAVGRVEVDGRAFGPRSLAGYDGRVVVADTFNDRLLVFDRQGTLLSLFPLAGPGGAGDEAAALPEVLPVSGVHAAAAAGSEEAGGDRGAVWINDVAVGPDGRYYLADAAAPRVLVLAPDGSLAEAVDLAPAAPGADPAGDAVWLLERIAVDEEGLLYLTHAYLSDALLARRITRVGGPDSKFAHLSTAALREGGAVVDGEGL